MIEQLLQFGQNHWVLCSLFVVIILLIVFEEVKNKLTGIANVSAPEAVLLLNRENGLVVDLRQQSTFAAGHIIDSVNITSSDLRQNMAKLDNHKNRPLILLGDNSNDAARIGMLLKRAGFDKLSILAGGISSWKSAQLPLNRN